jgi:SRSO17 transposase
VGIYMAYVSRQGHAIVDTRLYLPREWARDRGRRDEAGVPETIEFRTRHGLALEMLKGPGGRLPHAWVAGDDEMGRPSGFRRDLRTAGERYLLGVPSNLRIRDLEVAPPEYSGRGRPAEVPFARLDRWCRALPEVAWTRIDVRDGEKGPLVIESVKRRIRARTETGGTGPEELLLVTRGRQADGTYKHDYYFSNADPATPLKELARVAKAEHRVEGCFERAKGEAGLADYQGRNWIAWHHHQTLALLAAWFLIQETRRGENTDPCADVAATSGAHRGRDRVLPRHQLPLVPLSPQYPLVTTQRTSTHVCTSFA